MRAALAACPPGGSCCQQAWVGVNTFSHRRVSACKEAGKWEHMQSCSLVWDQENLVEGPLGSRVPTPELRPTPPAPDAPRSLKGRVLVPPLSAFSIQLHWHLLPPVCYSPLQPAGFSCSPSVLGPRVLSPPLSSGDGVGLSRGLACEWGVGVVLS